MSKKKIIPSIKPINNNDDNNIINYIVIRGAREHNLKNISISIPKNKVVVITGVSGSGKSTLAFDTIYAEGQRRYVESLSAYARQFLAIMNKPDTDGILGLSPAIAIDQKTVSHNPRSTVGTVTEIYDYMRLLFARLGTPYSPTTGKPIRKQSVNQIVESIKKMKSGSRLYLLAPIIRSKKGEHKKELSDVLKKGYQRAFINNKLYNLQEAPELKKTIRHNIDIVIDRFVIDSKIGNRLADSIELSLNLSDGIVYTYDADTTEKNIFSANFACPVSGFTIEEIEPRLFSFNSPFGACKDCDGLGVNTFFNEDLIVPNKELSINQNAIKPWSNKTHDYYTNILQDLSSKIELDLDAPYENIDKDKKNILLYGYKKINFLGIINILQKQFNMTREPWIREDYNKYRKTLTCNTCKGYRLNEKALSVKIDKKNISEITNLSIDDTIKWFLKKNTSYTNSNKLIAAPIIKEIINRLNFLADVGLNYLSLSRTSSTLSGGESQRIRLASQIGSGLTGVLYVLDEPSIGLHQRDNNRLLKTLFKLKNLGNTVIVVEHDSDAIKNADHVIDMGPYAGVKGGNVVAEGSVKDIMNCKESLTGKYLSGILKIETPSERRVHSTKYIEILEASTNNLKKVNVKIPLGIFSCFTGVSGSGKSSLIIDTLYPAISNSLNNSHRTKGKYKDIKGIHYLDKIINITQSPIGRTPRSNPATYTGAFTHIRDWFAILPESKARGYKSGRYSFNIKGGRCEACSGDGLKKIEMHFLSDVYVKCEECKGKRYNKETLEIKYRNKNISDILDMPVADALIFFKAIPSIYNKLEMLEKVGLSYIKIGQSATTLSGGEAQRVKLSKELSKKPTGKTIYILDEPTTGLHFEDIKKLIEVMQRLASKGNTILVIEHNMDVIKSADWVFDLGPEGGDKGGKIICEGTPEKISKDKTSYTGKYLKQLL